MEHNGESRNRSHKYGQLVFDKGAKEIQWSKDSLFNKWCWKNWTYTCKKKKSLNTDLISFTKMNSKWVTDPNVKHKTIKLLEDNTGETQKIQEKPR